MKISVCMATYNGQLFIKEQLDSILCQLHKEDEVIISDDCSTDNTLDIIDAYNDTRIKILKGKKFASPIFNFENALKYANGDVIFLSDQDDIWMPEKVKSICKALESYDLVFSNAQIVNKRNEIIRDCFYCQPPDMGVFKNLLFNNYFGATMAFRRCVLEKALPFPACIPMHDQWLGIIARYYFSTKFLNMPLIRYRRHDGNASFCAEKSRNSGLKKVMFRFNIIRALLSRIL